MVYCPNCGNQTDDASRFCDACGQGLTGSAGSIDQSQPTQPGYPMINAAQPATAAKPGAGGMMSAMAGKKTLLLLIAAMIVLGAVAYTQLSGGTKYYMSMGSSGVVNKDYYLELNDDGTFLLKDLNMNVSGTYEIFEGTITLTPGQSQGLSSQRGTIKGDTITDPEGVKWIKR